MDCFLYSKIRLTSIATTTLYITIMTYLLQDIESRHEKVPGLLGEGPAPPQQQIPILPPSVG